MKISLTGEFRCVVKDSAGLIVTDTGYNENMILNQGLDFFGGGHGATINAKCAIGTGSIEPVATQTKLESFLALTGAVTAQTVSEYSLPPQDGTYKFWERKMYTFSGLGAVVIKELGLVSTGTTAEDYYLTTRSLIKDSQGNNSSLTLKEGDTLDLYYKINKYIPTADEVFQVNLLDAEGAPIPYNVTVRPAAVGDSNSNSVSTPLKIFTSAVAGVFYQSTELESITTKSTNTTRSGARLLGGSVSLGDYLNGSYKRTLFLNFGVDAGNLAGGLRTLNNRASYNVNLSSGIVSKFEQVFDFYPFQLRFGSVAGDLPIPKNANETLTVPLQISWGRLV